MVRVVGITLASLIGLVILLGAGVLILLRTPYGVELVDDVSRPLVEEAVREQLGSEISYDPLIGPLPEQLVLRNIALSEEGEAWFEAERLILHWNPWAFLTGELVVDQIVLDTANLHRMPTLPESPDDASLDEQEEPASGQGLPFDVHVRNLVVDDFTLGETILGSPHTLSLQSTARLLRPILRIDLFAETDDGLDEVYLSGTIDRQGADLDLSVVSEKGGTIADASQAEGRVELRLRAIGDYDALEAELQAAAGRYGSVRGEVHRLADQSGALGVQVSYQPGSMLPPDVRAVIGESVDLTTDLILTRASTELQIQDLSGAFGEISGTLIGTLRGQRSLDLDLKGMLREEILSAYGAEALSGPLYVEASIQQANEAYRFGGRLSAGLASFEILNGISDENVLFDVGLTIDVNAMDLGPANLAPLLAEGARVETQLTYSVDDVVTVRDLSARVGQSEDMQVLLEGDVRLHLETEDITTDFSLDVGPAALALALPEAALDSALTLSASANGRLDSLGLSLSGQIPGGSINQRPLPPGQITATFSGLPNQPNGTLTVSGEEVYNIEAAMRSDQTQLILETLQAQFGQVSLQGEGIFDHDTAQSDARLSFQAGERSQLITGQILSGALDAVYSHQPADDRLELSVIASDLRIDDNAIGALSLTATGPLEKVSYDLLADDIAAGDVFLNRMQSVGILSLGTAQQASIDQLTVSLSEDEKNPRDISLVRPTMVAWGDGLQLSDTRIAWLDDGIVTANARIDSDSWFAQLAAQRIAVPGTDTFISIQLNLDTADSDPASFQIVAATEGPDDRYALRADGRWTGQEVLTDGVIIRSGRERIGRFAAAVPLVLQQSSGLAVEMPDGAITASLDYDDQFAPLLAFLPLDGAPIRGGLTAHIEAEGPVDDLAVEGLITLADVRAEDPEFGVTVMDLGGEITFAGRGSAMTAEVDLMGSGREQRENSVRLSGRVETTPEDSTLDLRLLLDQAQLARNAELELRVTSDLRFTGSLMEATLAGPITVDELDLAIPDTEGSAEAPTYVPVNLIRIDQPSAAEAAFDVADTTDIPLLLNLDLDVQARNGLFVRGRGLESEWGIDLAIQGTADEPALRGDVQLVDGTLELGGRSFALTEGLVSFTPETSLDPALDIEAQTVTGTAPDEVTAIVDVTGSSSEPTISFRSDPSLPEEDVLALILFGRAADQLGAAEALQLARAAATLTGTGPFGGAGLTSALRSGLGLDRLSFDPEGQSLTVGKYIADDVYVSAVQGIGEIGTAFSVVYEVSRFFSLQSTLKSNGAQALSGNYKRDY